MIKTINKKICLEDGINILIDLEIPLRVETIEFDDSMIEDILINQCLSGLRDAISTYRGSKLPTIFLKGQEIIITNKLPNDIYGSMMMLGDTMLIDADAISNIRPVKASFLFAHEMGHKIEKYRSMGESKELISRLLGMSLYGHERLINEAISDEIGTIAIGSNGEGNRFTYHLEEEQHLILQHTILRDIYRV